MFSPWRAAHRGYAAASRLATCWERNRRGICLSRDGRLTVWPDSTSDRIFLAPKDRSSADGAGPGPSIQLAPLRQSQLGRPHGPQSAPASTANTGTDSRKGLGPILTYARPSTGTADVSRRNTSHLLLTEHSRLSFPGRELLSLLPSFGARSCHLQWTGIGTLTFLPAHYEVDLAGRPRGFELKVAAPASGSLRPVTT